MSDKQKAYNFATRFPARTMAMFYTGVFCLFAPIGVLMVSEIANPPTLAGWLIIGGFSGFTAVGWALVGTWNWKLAFVIGPTQVFWPLMFGMFREEMYGNSGPSLDPNSAVVIALAVAAYVIFVQFIRTQGVSALRLETEIALAQKIHEDQVPPIDVQTDRLTISGRSVASTEMGGDLIDVVTSRGHTDVVLADVTGHGVKAGIIMTMLKSAVRTRLRTGGEIEHIARDINDVFEELTDPGMFATFVMLRFGAGSDVSIINAGHPPVLRRTASGEITSHDSTAMPMGVAPDQHFDAQRVELSPGDTLLLYTDGFTEVANKAGEMPGQALVDRALAEGGSPAGIIEALLEAASAWGAADDDRSAIAVSVR